MRLLRKLGRFLADKWYPALLAALIAGLGAGSIMVGAGVTVPEPLPEYALESEDIYRAEVSGVWFTIFYAMAMAIGLSFSGRGFVRFGPRGVEPGRIFTGVRARRRTARSFARIQDTLNDVLAPLDAITVGLEHLALQQGEIHGVLGVQAARIDGLERRIQGLESENVGLRDELARLQTRIDSDRT